MDDKNKYVQQMDEIRLSPEKADETLKLLLKTNDELRSKKKREPISPLRRFAPALMTLAVGAAALMIVLTMNGGLEYASVNLGSLPASVDRAEQGASEDFETVFSVSPQELFEGWTIVDERVYPVSLGGDWTLADEGINPVPIGGHEAALTITQGNVILSARVTDFECALYTVLKNTDSKLEGVKLNKDPLTGVLSAVWQKDGRWIVIEGSVDQGAFERAAKELSR